MTTEFLTGLAIGFIGGSLLFFGTAVWVTLRADRRARSLTGLGMKERSDQ